MYNFGVWHTKYEFTELKAFEGVYVYFLWGVLDFVALLMHSPHITTMQNRIIFFGNISFPELYPTCFSCSKPDWRQKAWSWSCKNHNARCH